jgi:metallothiol transferase
MKLKAINHITISVSELQRSVAFYGDVLGADMLVLGRKLAYFDLCGIWLALNVEENIPRSEIYESYTHIASTVDEADLPAWEDRLRSAGVAIEPSRPRHPRDGKSIYFRDPDGHLLEMHTGSLEERLQYYKDEMPHMLFRN